MSVVGTLGTALCWVAAHPTAEMGLLGGMASLTVWIAMRRKGVRLAAQRQQEEFEALHRSIVHAELNSQPQRAEQMVQEAYTQQLGDLTAEQGRVAEVLKGNPRALASYLQALSQRMPP